MVIVEYSSGKLVTRALLLFAVCLVPFSNFSWVLLKLYLVANGARAMHKAMASDKAAVVVDARGIEIRTLWRKRLLSYDDYTHVSVETLSLGIPFLGLAMLVFHSDKSGWTGKRTISIPIGFLRFVEGAVPLVRKAIELAALQHRAGAAAWHTVREKRNADNVAPPPRELATAAEREARVAARRDPLEGMLSPRPLATTKEHATARRDPLEGAPRGRLDRPPPGGFGRKVA